MPLGLTLQSLVPPPRLLPEQSQFRPALYFAKSALFLMLDSQRDPVLDK